MDSVATEHIDPVTSTNLHLNSDKVENEPSCLETDINLWWENVRVPLKAFDDKAIYRTKSGKRCLLFTWLITTFISLASSADLNIVERKGGTCGISQVDAMVMLISSQLIIYGIWKNRPQLGIPWLMAMLRIVVSLEIRTLLRAGYNVLSAPFLVQVTFLGALSSFVFKMVLWTHILIFVSMRTKSNFV